MIWLKRGLSLILLAVLIYFFWPLIGEFKKVDDLFREAQWIWLGVAVLIQVVSYIFLTWLNVLSLQPFSGQIGFVNLAFVLTSMAFIEVAIPSAGASGVALRIRMLGKYGYSPESALFSLVIETLSEFVALVSVALLGVVYLLNIGRLSWLGLTWLILAGVAVLILIYLSWRLILDEVRCKGIVFKMAGLWNRFLGRFYVADLDQLEDRLKTFRHNLRHYYRVPVWKFVLAAFGKVFLDVATLGACFYLFNYVISPGNLFTGYGLILTFSGLASLPAGLGMADAYVPVLFSWLAVPGSVALAAGLTYRLIAFWMVRFTGYFAFHYLENNYQVTSADLHK